MDVNVHSVLPGGLSDVHADVVAVRMMLFFDHGLSAVEQPHDGGFLLRRHIEEIRHMAARHDQNMSTGQAVVVMADVCEFVFKQDHVRLAKLAAMVVRHRATSSLAD